MPQRKRGAEQTQTSHRRGLKQEQNLDTVLRPTRGSVASSTLSWGSALEFTDLDKAVTLEVPSKDLSAL